VAMVTALRPPQLVAAKVELNIGDGRMVGAA